MGFGDKLEKIVQLRSRYVLSYSLSLIQVLTIMMKLRGLCVASWYIYVSSFMSLSEDCS